MKFLRLVSRTAAHQLNLNPINLSPNLKNKAYQCLERPISVIQETTLNNIVLDYPISGHWKKYISHSIKERL